MQGQFGAAGADGAGRGAGGSAGREDWRDALRTKPDEYRLYEERKARRDRERRVRVEFGPSPLGQR